MSPRTIFGQSSHRDNAAFITRREQQLPVPTSDIAGFSQDERRFWQDPRGKGLTGCRGALLLIFNTKNPGEIPEGWRAASGSLIFKRDKRADPGNYRPGRLIAVPGQIMGWVIGDTVSQKIRS